MKRFPRVALALCGLAACTLPSGKTMPYGDATASIYDRGTGTVAVGVHDQRPYVKPGNKPASFVGLMRGGYGNPFDVTTASGRPLAQEMTDSVVRSLASAGFQVAPVLLTQYQDAAAAKASLLQGSPRRAVLLTLREWKSDTFQNTDLIYDVFVTVYDGAGKELLSMPRSGRDELGGAADPRAHALQAVPQAFQRRLGSLLGPNEVGAALQ